MRALDCLTRPAAAILVLLVGTYAYFYQAGGWNANSRFDLVRAVVEETSVRIDSTHRNTGDKACRNILGLCERKNPRPDDHFYSDKAPGSSWFAVPIYAALYAGWLDDPPTESQLNRAAYAVTLWSSAIPGAIGAVMLYWILTLMGVRATAAASVAIAYGLGTLAFPYSTLFYGHQLMTILIFAAFALLAAARLGRIRLGNSGLFGVGCLLGFSVVVEYPAALAVGVLCVYAAAFVRPFTRLVWIALGGGVLGIALASYHTHAFGSAFSLPYDFSTQPHRHMGFMGLGIPDPEALVHILVTPYRGLFLSSPWLLLAMPGAFYWVRGPGRRTEVVVCAAIVLLFVWLNASLVDWQGGYTLGARYLVPTIPFLALLAAGIFLPVVHATSRRRYRAVAITLVSISCGLMLVGTAVEPEAPMHIRSPFVERLIPAFVRGELSINTQSIDRATRPKDGRRFAWNLGEKIGLSGLPSLLPLFIFLTAATGWLIHNVRAEERSSAIATNEVGN